MRRRFSFWFYTMSRAKRGLSRGTLWLYMLRLCKMFSEEKKSEEHVMYFTTTNGQQIFIPEMCQFCDMGTGGGHQYNCPLYPHERYEIRIVFINELGHEVEEKET